MHGRRFINLLGSARKSSGPSSYLGQLATRSVTANSVNTSSKQIMSRTRHIARQAITSLQINLPNWALTLTTGVEVGSGGTVVFTAAIEYPAGTFTQVKFSGSATSGAVANGSSILSDAVSVSIPSGAFFFVRVFYTGVGGIVFTNISGGAGAVSDLANGEAFAFAASGLTDQTMSGTITDGTGGTGSFIYAPTAIVAQTTSPSVFIFGDSRPFGLNDSYDSITPTSVGEVARAVGQNFAYINAGVASATMNGWLSNNTQQLLLAQYCSHVICEYGINDIVNNARTAAQVLSDRQSAAALFTGKKFFHTTLPPETTSSDSWATLANQTVAATNGVRVTFNDNVRLGVPWAAGFFDITSIAESSLDSGKWIVNGTANFATRDGIHETPAMNNLIASSGIIPPSAIHR